MPQPSAACAIGACPQAASTVALHTRQRDRAEHQALAWQLQAQDALGQLDRAGQVIRQLQAELQALTQAVDGAESGLRQRLAGQRLLYVGGRPSSLGAIRRVAEGAGAIWLHHHAGVEDGRRLRPELRALLRQADRVALPVDTVSPEAQERLARLCGRLGRPFHALRSASMGSFVAGLMAGDPPPVGVSGAGADHRAHMLAAQCRR